MLIPDFSRVESVITFKIPPLRYALSDHSLELLSLSFKIGDELGKVIFSARFKWRGGLSTRLDLMTSYIMDHPS